MTAISPGSKSALRMPTESSARCPVTLSEPFANELPVSVTSGSRTCGSRLTALSANVTAGATPVSASGMLTAVRTTVVAV